jgi:hypothetical protein
MVKVNFIMITDLKHREPIPEKGVSTADGVDLVNR